VTARVDAHWRGRGYCGPCPQTGPGQFSDDEIADEVRYLMGLNRTHGTNPLRTAAYMRLDAVLAHRKARR
jgi:hypothetical protein